MLSPGDDNLGHTSLVQHQIETGDSQPMRQPPHQIPLAQSEKVAEMVDD